MKKTIISIGILLISASQCMSQETDSVQRPMTKQDYLQKSRNQRTCAFVFLGLGVALDIGGIATTVSNADKELGDIFDTNRKSVDHTGEYILYIAGTAALVSSVICFTSAKKNKRRALSLSFKSEQGFQLQRGMVYNTVIPSLNIKFRLP